MRYSLPTTLLVAVFLAASNSYSCEARRSSSRPPVSRSSGRSRGALSPRRTSSRGREEIEDYSDASYGGVAVEDDEYDDVLDDGYDDEEIDDLYDEYDVEPRSRRSPKRGGRSPPSSSSSSSSRSRSRKTQLDEYDEEEDYMPRRPSSRRSGSAPSRKGSRGGRDRVVPYGSGRRPARPAPSAFTRGLSALRESIPDAAAVKDATFGAMQKAKESTSKISSNLYRDIKGLTSSELEQVMLKATKPDDTPVKGKHVERLVGVTYQISGRYDIYDAVLRKLWAKMTENDWRTSIKALYVLHRFSADGAPDHQPALKARLRELRRTVDPKRKGKYFNTKQLLAGDDSPNTAAYRALMARYSHFVLLRAQCFGGMFNEIGQKPPVSKKSQGSTSVSAKPITSTRLRAETLDAAQMILKAGCACALKEGEVCENTAIAIERVVADMMGLTSATAKALNTALSSDDDSNGEIDGALIQKWCQFYSEELLPKTKSMMKRTSPKLDAYGLFLPSRIGASLSQDLLEKGLSGLIGNRPSSEKAEQTEETPASSADDRKEEISVEEEDNIITEESTGKTQTEEQSSAQKSEEVGENDNLSEYDVYDEYEYDEEEYYDQE